MSNSASQSNISLDDMLNIIPKNSETTLENVLLIMEVLASWLIKSGIGYSDFIVALKPIFYSQALKELDSIGQKRTDSLLSLLSGLNRRDIKYFSEQKDIKTSKNYKSSVPARVVTLWIHKKLDSRIPFSGDENSFEHLVKEISTEKHPRSIFLELQRLGLVTEIGETVILKTESFTPSQNSSQIKELLAQNVSDHLSAGIHNILTNPNYFLEQSIHADDLTKKSIQELTDLSKTLWKETTEKILNKAMECCEVDQGRDDANMRFRLGIYQYHDLGPVIN